MNYRKCIVDRQIDTYLRLFGAVVIEGPKWCGKTWAARKTAASEFDVANPADAFRNREVARLNPSFALEGAAPHLIDEWQEVPILWDAVRSSVDRSGAKGRYVMTGSSTPDDLDESVFHSGAGRFGRIELGTMTFSELGISTGTLSVESLLAREVNIPVGGLVGNLDFPQLAKQLCKGGWPGLLEVDSEDAIEVVDSYLQVLTEVDISRIDRVKRDPAKVKALLASLSRNVASNVKHTTLGKDMQEFSSTTLGAETIAEYLRLLRRLFIVRELPAWEPALKSTVRLRTTPKRLLADSSLACSSLGAGPEALIQDPKLTGALFENQVLHDVRAYAQSSGARLYSYLDNSGLEIDGILERRDGNWGALEVKLGWQSEDDAAEKLLRLYNKLEYSRQKMPAFLAVIVGIGAFAKQRDDGVIVIPVDHLGP
ncbi:MAG: DUF4143 domain-containing protein [Actinomycetes bacterium]|nr:DUF4143 domain-containing protein [Actinomycetes bacterium]